MPRQAIELHINRQRHRVVGDQARMSLSQYLRELLGLTGTKIVCSEGDCGACTVLLARPRPDQNATYQPIDACIAWMFQLDGCHVLTVDSLAQSDALHPVQQAMVDGHGSQCGFCTPGFVMNIAGLAHRCSKEATLDPRQLERQLTGNLCRCTGYVQILDAGRRIAPSACPALPEVTSTHVDGQDVRVTTTNGAEIYLPGNLEQAVDFLDRHSDATVVAGATDVGVRVNKRLAHLGNVLYIGGLDELRTVQCGDNAITLGAAISWSELLDQLPDPLEALSEILDRFGAPQIRNMGTLGGNIVNASPIADVLPLLYVTQARLRLQSVAGRREVNIEDFYQGYKKLDLQPGELLTQVVIPKSALGDTLKLYKVSKRRDLDISTFTAAIHLTIDRDIIQQARIAYGGVGPTVVRLPQTENYLRNKAFSLDTLQQAGRIAQAEITPISDVRGSATYRRLLARNILTKAYHDLMPQPQVA